MLEQRRAKQKGFLTLKEAAVVAGYSPDYIGQLIRAGKIRGEQVYCGVAWMTTKEEVLSYLENKGTPSTSKSPRRYSLDELGLKLRFYTRRHATLLFVCLFTFTFFGAQLAIYQDFGEKFNSDRFVLLNIKN